MSLNEWKHLIAISCFTSTSFCPIFCLFFLHFCLPSHSEIIMCTVKSLITTFVEMQLKKENLKKFYGPKQVTNWICHCKSSLLHFKFILKMKCNKNKFALKFSSGWKLFFIKSTIFCLEYAQRNFKCRKQQS